MLDVVFRMEGLHLLVSGSMGNLQQQVNNFKRTYVDIHLAIQLVVDYELVCHLYSEWLHWVFLTVVELSHFGIVEVTNS